MESNDIHNEKLDRESHSYDLKTLEEIKKKLDTWLYEIKKDSLN